MSATPSRALCPEMLREQDVRMFTGIGVSLDLLEAAHIERVSDRDAREQFGIQGPASRDMAGWCFRTIRTSPAVVSLPECGAITPRLKTGDQRTNTLARYGDRATPLLPAGCVEQVTRAKHADCSRGI